MSGAKKRLGDFTLEEVQKLCESGKCDNCPFYKLRLNGYDESSIGCLVNDIYSPEYYDIEKEIETVRSNDG